MKQTEIIEKIDRLMTMHEWPGIVSDSAGQVIHALECYGSLVAVRDFADWIECTVFVVEDGSDYEKSLDRAMTLASEIYYDCDDLMRLSGIEHAIMVI